MPKETRPLSELLPSAFGPRDLGIAGGLMQRSEHGLTIEEDDDVARAALQAANMSYAPYSKSFAGVAVRTASGHIASGAYAENAAFKIGRASCRRRGGELGERGVMKKK